MRKVATFLAGLAFVACVTLAALFPLANGSVHMDLSVAAFGVAGTIVALVLPAASLGGDAARRTIDYYVDGMVKAARRPAPDSPDRALADARFSALEWAQSGVDEINPLRARIAAARWGSGLAYAALSLSMISLLEVARPVVLHIGRKPVLPWHVTVALALACLLLGALLFLPLAWWFWRFKSLESSEKVLRYAVEHPETVEPPSDDPSDGGQPRLSPGGAGPTGPGRGRGGRRG
jgi:hypothetical protein